MRHTKSRAAAVLALIMLLSSASAAIGTPLPALVRAADAGSSQITLIDANATMNTLSHLGVVRPTLDGGGSIASYCEHVGVAPCDQQTHDATGITWDAELVLPRCADGVSDFCIADVAIYRAGETRTSAAYLGSTAGPVVAAQPEYGLPYGGGTLLYDAPGVLNAGETSTYAVRAIEQMWFNQSTQKFEHNGFAIVVQPYVMETTTKDAPRFVPVTELPGFAVPSTVRASAQQWVQGDLVTTDFDGTGSWDGDHQHGALVDFSPNTRVAVTLRLPASAGGWFSGRIQDPLVSLTPLSASANELSIDALALTVPRLSATVPAGRETPLMHKLGLGAGSGAGIEAGFDDGVQWVEELRPFVNDRATSENTVWVVRGSPILGNPCFPTNRISGFVTTNATAYSWNPPSLVNGFLDYKVAGLHYAVDGQLTQGVYDLVLNSTTARCLYGFTSAPVSATVSVIGDAGESRPVATTVVSERGGWLKLAAYGFSFSSPTIRVHLAQEQPKVDPTPTATATPSPRATASAKPATKSTITCVKGKQTKKVTAVNPKCPTGWKKR